MDGVQSGLIVGDTWRVAPTRPAGLYGELPPLPSQYPAPLSARARKPRRAASAAD